MPHWPVSTVHRSARVQRQYENCASFPLLPNAGSTLRVPLPVATADAAVAAALAATTIATTTGTTIDRKELRAAMSVY